MERASLLIGNLRTPESAISGEQLACTAWPRAVGKKIATHTRAAKLVRTTLVVEVEDALWQRNLFGMSRHIVGNLARTIGTGVVNDVEFRIVPPRREPQRAVQISPGRLFDEADAIHDPVLRNIYRAARKRESA